MAGTIIDTLVSSSVTIGSHGITPKLTVTAKGEIWPGDDAAGYSASGLVLPADVTGANMINDGLILGGAGLASGQPDGGPGGDGVVLAAAATFDNRGGVYGYLGGSGATDGGAGGVGLVIKPTATDVKVINSGNIAGGQGGYGARNGGAGGAGVSISTSHTAILTNSGTIAGGSGGICEFGDGGRGGAGLYIHGDNSGTIINSGVISGGTGGFQYYAGGGAVAGGAGLISLDATRIINIGTIYGGAGGGVPEGQVGEYNATRDGGHGADGVSIGVGQFGTLTNRGFIAGGAGAFASNQGGTGGTGVYLYGVAINAGTITGGAGGESRFAGGTGGIGFYASGPHTTVTNAGVIIGGTGGGAFIDDGTGGRGGAAAYLYRGAELRNTGTILGGGSAPSYDYNGSGGDGVIVNGGILINAGTIIAGSPGAGNQRDGTYGSAVSFTGFGKLVVDPGAVFIGNVTASTYYTDVLEVAGTSATALTGIGSAFTNFYTIDFAHGASWTISGNEAGLASGEIIDGFAAGDGIDLSFITYSSTDRLTVTAPGILSIITGTGTYFLNISNAMRGESDFTLKPSADGILIGKTLTPAVMSFASSTQPLGHSQAEAWASIPPLAVHAANAPTSFDVEHPRFTVLDDVKPGLERPPLAAVTLHSWGGL